VTTADEPLGAGDFRLSPNIPLLARPAPCEEERLLPVEDYWFTTYLDINMPLSLPSL
jgi:hypothetical protein